VSEPRQADVWWGGAPDAKGRPYLVVTRDDAIPVLHTLLVAPVRRTIWRIPTEVPLGTDDGLPVDCVATMDTVLAFPKAMLVRRMGALPPARQHELCAALRATANC
jgi:mRNA interferase MazF